MSSFSWDPITGKMRIDPDPRGGDTRPQWSNIEGRIASGEQLPPQDQWIQKPAFDPTMSGPQITPPGPGASQEQWDIYNSYADQGGGRGRPQPAGGPDPNASGGTGYIDSMGTAPPGGRETGGGQQPRPNYPMYGGLGGIYGGYGGGYGGGSGGLGGYGDVGIYPPAPQSNPYGTTWQDYRGGANRPFNYPQRPQYQPMYGGGDPRMGGYGGQTGGKGMRPPRPSPYGGGLTRGFGRQMFGADPYAYAQQLGTLGAYQPQMPAQTDLQNLMGYQQQTFGQQVWPTTPPPEGTVTIGPVATTPGPVATTPGPVATTPGPVATTQGPGPTTTQGPGPATTTPQFERYFEQYRPQQQYGGYGRPPIYGGGYGGGYGGYGGGYGSGGLGGMYGGAYGGGY